MKKLLALLVLAGAISPAFANISVKCPGTDCPCEKPAIDKEIEQIEELLSEIGLKCPGTDCPCEEPAPDKDALPEVE